MRNSDPLVSLQRLAHACEIPALRRDLMAILHRFSHPMTDIIAKVPGESRAEKAKAIGVGRQTIYVWESERFRPVPVLAERISALTGVPAEHIQEWVDDTGGSTAETAPKLARRRKAASAVHGRADGGKPGVVAAQGRSRSVRKVRRRTRS